MSTAIAIKARRRMNVLSGQLDEMIIKTTMAETKINRQPLETDAVDNQWQRLEDEFYSLCECIDFVDELRSCPC